MTKLESKKLVVKDNRLINAKYDLSLQEQRLILWLISEIGPNDTDFQEYRIYISDLASFIGIENSHTIYDQMRAITKRLMTRVVELESVDGNMVLQAHWVDTAIYNKKSGCIDVRLSKELRPYLLEIKRNFTKYELKHAITMKSAHAIRIYELLKQYERIGTRFLPIEEIRRECGISPDQYDKYKDLRVRVVDISVREINDRSDIYIEYDEIKDGRKVIAINFKISKNKGAVLPDPIMDDPSTARHVFRLADYGITREKAQELVQKHSIEIIAWALGEISRRIKSKDKADAIDNPAGWIIKAIEEDWRPQRSLFNEEREQNNTKRVAEIEVNRKRKERISEIEPIITKIRNDYHTYEIALFVRLLMG